jgi:hypothetical protein
MQPYVSRAQPAALPVPANATVIADGLVNPRGFTWGPDGALYVAEAGTPPAGFVPSAGPPSPDALPITNTNGRILRIAPDGTRKTVADGLPVVFGMGNTVGAAGVAFVGDDLYALISAGPKHGHPEMPGGVYRVETDGSLELIADTDAYNVANPPVHANHSPATDELSNPYDMVAVDGKLYITDGNKDVIHVVDPAAPDDARIDRLADLSLQHRVLTGIAAGPDGNLYVTQLTPNPFPTGGAKVWRVSLDGQVDEVANGLSAATGLAVGP